MTTVAKALQDINELEKAENLLTQLFIFMRDTAIPETDEEKGMMAAMTKFGMSKYSLEAAHGAVLSARLRLKHAVDNCEINV
jgi:hypothetical protein